MSRFQACNWLQGPSFGSRRRRPRFCLSDCNGKRFDYCVPRHLEKCQRRAQHHDYENARGIERAYVESCLVLFWVRKQNFDGTIRTDIQTNSSSQPHVTRSFLSFSRSFASSHTQILEQIGDLILDHSQEWGPRSQKWSSGVQIDLPHWVGRGTPLKLLHSLGKTRPSVPWVGLSDLWSQTVSLFRARYPFGLEIQQGILASRAYLFLLD